MNKRAVISVDLGGTNIRVAIVSIDGKVLLSKKTSTKASEGPARVLKRLLAVIKQVIQEAGETDFASSIYLAIAGVVDVSRGLVTSSAHLPGWRDVHLREIVAREFGMDTYLLNDASAAALGEYYFGAGKGISNLIYLTVSTGIGGGIIIDNKLYQGRDGCAGELGHMIIKADGPKCSCGRYGCLEAMVSGTAISTEAIRRIQNGQSSILKKVFKYNNGNITSQDVAKASKLGDKLASEIISQAAYYLGIGLVNIVNIFNPDMIIIGGGLSKMGDMLLAPAKKIVKQTAFKLPASTVRIVRSRLGDDAGLLGAGMVSVNSV